MIRTVMKNSLLAGAAFSAIGLFFSCATSPAAIDAKNAAFREQNKPSHEAADAVWIHKYLQVGTVRWHYVEAGSSAGPTVLLLHGLPESWYSWSKVLPLLDPTFHYIVPDMKGYGQSTATDSDYNWHTVAKQTLDLMDALRVGKFYIIGHDWSALISSVMVADHPERFLGYVRMEADLNYTPGQNLEQLYAQKPQWKLFQDRKKAIALMRDAGYFQFSNWDLEEAVTKIANNTFDFPVLQLQADSDPSQPVINFADVATRYPNVKLIWITNASHFDNLDQPGQVAAAINTFLKHQ
jgi:pimeloyl-ACP methyl ester carboxylesterase